MKRASIISEYEFEKGNNTIWNYLNKCKSVSLGTRVNCVTVSDVVLTYAVPCKRSINLYKKIKNLKFRQIGGFSKPISCCDLRTDGNMIMGGEEGGLLRIYTTDKNAFLLRKTQAHEGNVVGAHFSSDGFKVISLGADCKAKVWDISVNQMETQFALDNQGEPPSALAVGKVNNSLFATGDLDGVVKLFDTRQNDAAYQFKLPVGVSALHMACGDDRIVAGIGQWVYSYDSIAGKIFCPTNSNLVTNDNGIYLHYKVITGLASCHIADVDPGEILISVGMDKIIKMTNLNTYEELHQITVRAPITAVGAFHSTGDIIIGCENGYLQCFNWALPNLESDKLKVKSIVDEIGGLDPSLSALAASLSGHWRGSNDPDNNLKSDEWFNQPLSGSRTAPKDWGFEGKRAPLIHETTDVSRAFQNKINNPAFNRIDRLLSKFEHSRALSLSFRFHMHHKKNSLRSHTLPPYTFPIAVVRELTRRNALLAAIAGRNDVQLTRILRFIRTNAWLKPALPTCVLLFKSLNKAYSSAQLESVPEFIKVCKLLKLMLKNTTAVQELSASILNLFSTSSTSKQSTMEVESTTPRIKTPKQRKSVESEQIP